MAKKNLHKGKGYVFRFSMAPLPHEQFVANVLLAHWILFQSYFFHFLGFKFSFVGRKISRFNLPTSPDLSMWGMKLNLSAVYSNDSPASRQTWS